MFADIFLSKITDLGVYSSLNKSLPEKFGKYVDFYSQSRDQMFELATATATTLNTILGFSQITNGYLNDDGDFGKEWYSIKENSLTDIIPPLPSGKEEISISLDENKNKVIEIEGKTINKKGHPKNVMFDYFHVRREMMIFGENRGTNKKILQQKLNLRKSYERTHFLYGNPKAIGG
ncbi:Uncharacterised protein [Mesomycoplasma dispar]|uniref:Uncharacterized protein n=1 Tax=Mesomycoplasma dispar TaxID=86660 RepID=A0AAJ5NKY3_9BACT|nr:hypothetical protein [Mesomycoplasma dispar]AJR12520.1 hypothetical protein MDIS_01070 [Mesomycoplasma dispar]VEU61412.1 Uncharacterised protein [Mesomycoplasma dispar]